MFIGHKGPAASNENAAPLDSEDHQSESGYGSELGWRMSRTVRRVSEPASETAIGQPSGTIAAPPALAVMTPFGVSTHCEPLTTYQASGPG